MKDKKIEYLWHINNDDFAQFWTKGGVQHYLSVPCPGMPKELVNATPDISAPAPLPSDPLRRRGISYAGLTSHLSGYFHSRGKRPYNVLLFILGGKISVTFDDHKEDVTCGRILCVPSGCVCQESVRSGKAVVFWLHIDNSSRWNFGAKARSMTSKIFDGAVAILRLYTEEVYRDGRSISYLESLADVLAELLSRQFGAKGGDEEQTIRACAENIASKPQKNWSRNAAAARLGLAPAIADKLFVKYTGMTISQNVYTARMRLAEKMIAAGCKDYQKIAAKTNYSSVAALSKAFKRFCGKSLRNFDGE